MLYRNGMTIPPTTEEEVSTLLAGSYPGLTEAERREVLVDLEQLSRWLLEQVELENPALEELEKGTVSRKS
jgi:hypothetical protein